MLWEIEVIAFNTNCVPFLKTLILLYAKAPTEGLNHKWREASLAAHQGNTADS